MIRELKAMLDKYKQIGKQCETVTISQIIRDLHYLISEARVKRLPKNER